MANQDTTGRAMIAVNKTSNRKMSDSLPKTNDWLVTAFNSALAWIDVNLLPILCLAILCAFAVLGFASKLNNLSDTQKIVLSIAVVALLAVKTGRVIHKK